MRERRITNDRPGRRPRIVSLIIVCLLIGTLINLALAWSFGWWGERPQTEDFTSVNPTNQDLRVWQHYADDTWPSRPDAVAEACCRGLTYRKLLAVVNRLTSEDYDLSDEALQARFDRRQTYVVSTIECGWPARSISVHTGQHYVATNVRPWEFTGIVSVGGLNLPLRPSWPGFIVNTLLYAAAVATTVMLPVHVRRRWRVRRGRCSACGYPLQDSERCPECGRQRI